MDRYVPGSFTDMTLRADAVVPTNKRDRLLPGVVQPLLDSPVIDRGIIVDDDPDGDLGPHREDDDGIANMSDRIDVVASGGVGPALARQVGAEAASADLILFLDDGVRPPARPPRP